MSGKIKAKDLSYDSTLPPFLQKLHARNAGRGDVDRHERPLARPKKAKDADSEDDPTVVDERGETLTKEELAGLTDKADASGDKAVANSKTDETDTVAARADAGSEESAARPRENLTDGIVQKKRKVAKVIGENTTRNDSSSAKSNAAKSHKATSKAKRPKLAFADDEG